MSYKYLKFEIKANKKLSTYLQNNFWYTRFCYNRGLDIWEKLYEDYKNGLREYSPNEKDVRKESVKLREDWETDRYKYSNMSNESAIINLGKSFKNFREGLTRYPKIKGSRSKKNFTIYKKNQYSINFDEFNRLKIYGYKDKIILKEKTDMNLSELDFKLCTFSEIAGRYYIGLTYKVGLDNFKHDSFKKNLCGIDVGLKTLAIIYDGNDNNDYKRYNNHKDRMNKIRKKISSQQKVLSKKDYGSNRYVKERIKLQKLMKHEEDLITDYLHKVSTNICKTYKNIVIEDIKVKDIIKTNRKRKNLITSLMFNRLYTLRTMLEYKSIKYGNNLIIVPSDFPSTQICSNCGCRKVLKGKMTINDRIYDCKVCGHKEDRDNNAAKVLYQYGMDKLVDEGLA